jgi:signal transduction histidine kinase
LSRAAVLENLEKQVNTRTRHLSTLYEISSVAGEPDEVETLMQRMLEITLEVMNSPAGAIHRFDETASHLSLLAEVNFPVETRAAFSNLPVSAVFWRNLVESSEPLVIPDLKTDTRIPHTLAACPFPALLAAPIRAKGRCLGLFSIFNYSILDYTIEDVTLFTTIAEQIAGAVERARLQHQAERAAVAEERQRLARELHDSISQLLYSLVLYAGAGRKVLRQSDLDNTAEYLRRIDQTSLQALKEMRLMVYELRPSVFHEEGLVGALNRRLQAVEKRTGMNAQLLVEGLISLDEAVELALYRITEEALNNTLKHAEATQVLVRITSQTGKVILEIKDDGKGFRLEDARAAGGLGLVGIQERVNHLGGKLEITSAPGKGTRILVSLEGFE